MLAMTGGIGWLVFSRDPADFKTMFTKEVYRADWFKPMCSGACTNPKLDYEYGPNATGDTTNTKPDTTGATYSADYGCSFKKAWTECTTGTNKQCRDLSGLIPQFWFDEPSDVSIMQNSSHMCLTGLFLPYSPFSQWRDCILYNVEHNPEARFAIMWRANWVFFAALCIAVVVEILYVRHLTTYRVDFYRHGSHTAKRVLGGVYHLFIGILAIMLGGLTIDTQAYYREEMTPDMIDSVTDLNGNTYEPYNERLSCFNSDSAMLVWNSALTLHKAGREESYDTQYVSEYSVVYVSFLLGFGIVFILSVPLLWVTDGSEESGRRRRERPSARGDRVYIKERGWYERIEDEPNDEVPRDEQQLPPPPQYPEDYYPRQAPQSIYSPPTYETVPSAPERPPESEVKEKEESDEEEEEEEAGSEREESSVRIARPVRSVFF